LQKSKRAREALLCEGTNKGDVLPVLSKSMVGKKRAPKELCVGKELGGPSLYEGEINVS